MNRVTRILLTVPLLAALASCGGGSGTSTAGSGSAEVPVISAAGTSTGAAITGSIDAAGGAVTEPGTGAVVTADPGTFAASTEVTLQPTSDTLPFGMGDGITISSSAAPGTPLHVTLPFGSDITAPGGLGLAVQEADGSWQSLEPVRIDAAARTITAALREPPASGAAGRHARGAAGSGKTVVKYLKFYIKPDGATVHVGKSVSLVPWVRQSSTYCPPASQCGPSDGPDCDLLGPPCSRPVIEDLVMTNSKAGYTRTWKVETVPGGNSSLGTITATGSVGATYQAPQSRPSPDPVTVWFVSEADGGKGMVFFSAEVDVTDSYGVFANFTATGFPICGYMNADVTDYFSLEVLPDSNGDGGWTVDTFINQASNIDNKVKRPSLTGSATGDDAFDMLNADGGQVLVISGAGTDEFLVTVTGTSTSSSCTWNPPDSPSTTVPSVTVPDELLVDFFADGFNNGKQTAKPFPITNSTGVWTFEVDEQ
ncbi:MAG TPA: hypothetical protein VFG59_01585 [Anaeromyxobacter sp.]|nr:hypothetical protein [Anaeromyxobacter sp.]